MKYIKKFNTEEEKNTWRSNEEYVPYNLILMENNDVVEYNIPRRGVFIQHIDGSFYTLDEWVASGLEKESSNGVALLTDKCNFLIKHISLNTAWYQGSPNVSGCVLISEQELALKDLDGELNTHAVVAANPDKDSQPKSSTTSAFRDGELGGYMPSLGELYEIYLNIDSINSAMELVGYRISGVLVSSTLYDGKEVWELDFSNGQPNHRSTWDHGSTRFLRRIIL